MVHYNISSSWLLIDRLESRTLMVIRLIPILKPVQPSYPAPLQLNQTPFSNRHLFFVVVSCNNQLLLLDKNVKIKYKNSKLKCQQQSSIINLISGSSAKTNNHRIESHHCLFESTFWKFGYQFCNIFYRKEQFISCNKNCVWIWILSFFHTSRTKISDSSEYCELDFYRATNIKQL